MSIQLIIPIFIFLLKHYFCTTCDISTPIKKEGQCVLTYCKSEEFQSGTCIIENEIIKTQWLNNRIDFPEKGLAYTIMTVNSDGQLFVRTAGSSDGLRYFFALKNNGRPFFLNENEKETFFYKVNVKDSSGNGYEADENVIFFMKISPDFNKEYLITIRRRINIFSLEKQIMLDSIPVDTFLVEQQAYLVDRFLVE